MKRHIRNALRRVGNGFVWWLSGCPRDWSYTDRVFDYE